MNEQQRAVVQQALEVLKRCQMNEAYRNFERESHTITALQQLLEQQPAQEPKAFLHWYDNAHWGNEDFKEGCHRSWNAAIEHTTPPAQPAAWVDLTDEDEKQIYDEAEGSVSCAIELTLDKLRKKNGGKA